MREVNLFFNQLEIDERDNCFVCGNTKPDFGKISKDFRHHVSEEHNPWKYVYFLYYLKDKGEDELNGLEFFTWTCFKENSTSWVPIGDTLFLPSGEEDEDKEEDSSKKIKAIEDRLNLVKEEGAARMKNIKLVLKEIITKCSKPSYVMKPLRDIASGDPVFGVVSNNSGRTTRTVRIYCLRF